MSFLELPHQFSRGQGDSNDVGPNGVRYLGSVDVSGTARQPIAIDIPQSPISFDVSIGGQPLPSMSCDGDAHNLYAVARDTDVWHSIETVTAADAIAGLNLALELHRGRATPAVWHSSEELLGHPDLLEAVTGISG